MAASAPLKLRERKGAAAALPPWRVLVVDDDEQVHAMTGVLLRDFSFEGRGFSMVSAHSAAEATAILQTDPNIPVVLLDVVMETPDSGLRLVRHLRDDLKNHDIRIILRTGQPGEAPERDVVVGYDVNDYKAKSELTAQKLFTALVGALRAWRDIDTINRLNRQLLQSNEQLEMKVAERTAELVESHDALIRAKERAEVALERETSAKGQLRQFLSMVSHEFRTPLAIIDSAAQMLMMRATKVDSGMLTRLETIRGAVSRLIDLIGTCLADEQLETGRMIVQEQALDLAPILRAAVAHHQAASGGRQIELEMGRTTQVWGDSNLLPLVVNNLLSNALKYSKDTPVSVRLRASHGGVTLSVRDHGIGIPATDQDRIFERFYRAGNAHKLSGSGIGLHMVKQIVDLHGGSIALESTENQGTLVTVHLRTPPRDR
ncbi:hybrid sensor histidine kinase/response regulator [Magnetospirillum sp. 64-120]|mgnify:CR=1 FL=1|uniref:ATP-binding response regulator n=1 Tax=Magnetospirillum sp. 64-120 TaxID=1895778 RepID=UPI00092B14B6|nr:hybrid sensor histidine kinase/response regulator [Magnetospirillum sp. 64-120]OJX68027.1 MAG: histidine kinase [Magnetospirillum sp. 64-120]